MIAHEEGPRRFAQGLQVSAAGKTLTESDDRGPAKDPQRSLTEYQEELAANARDSGAGSAYERSGITWRELVESELEDLIAWGGDFTSDDLSANPESPNAIGSVLLKASKDGRIVCVGIERSKRISRHAGMLRVWRAAP